MIFSKKNAERIANEIFYAGFQRISQKNLSGVAERVLKELPKKIAE